MTRPNRNTVRLALALLLIAALGRHGAVHADGATVIETTRAGQAASAVEDGQVPLTEIDIVFVTASFKAPGLATEQDEKLIDWKVPDIAKLMQERAPKVLAANGLKGQVIVLPTPEPGGQADLSTLAPDRPALLLLPTKFAKSSPRLFIWTGYVEFDTTLVNPGPQTPRPRARIQLRGGLGADPVWGAMKINRVDASWVDGQLMGLLSSYARQGVIQLSGEKAVAPPP